MNRQCYVYIMTNWSRILYVGVTNDLEQRVHEHKSESIEGFTKRYKITRLVYFDETSNMKGLSLERKRSRNGDAPKRQTWLKRPILDGKTCPQDGTR